MSRKARDLLLALTALPGHQFRSDELSLLDVARFPRLPASKDLTDHYLLGMAVHHHARLVTLDLRIDPAWLPGGHDAFLSLVPPSSPRLGTTS